jgi:hypothetical protein
MVSEKLRTIVITAIPKPTSRERFCKIAETILIPRTRVLRTRCLPTWMNRNQRAPDNVSSLRRSVS